MTTSDARKRLAERMRLDAEASAARPAHEKRHMPAIAAAMPTPADAGSTPADRDVLRWPTTGHEAIGEAIACAVIEKVFPTHQGALDAVRGVVAKVMRSLVEVEAQAEHDRQVAAKALRSSEREYWQHIRDLKAERDHWQGRFERMRTMYRERFNEGLSTEDWHLKYCGAMQAGRRVEAERDALRARLAAVEALVGAMGDPHDPKCLHPQAAGLLVQLRDALGGAS